MARRLPLCNTLSTGADAAPSTTRPVNGTCHVCPEGRGGAPNRCIKPCYAITRKLPSVRPRLRAASNCAMMAGTGEIAGRPTPGPQIAPRAPLFARFWRPLEGKAGAAAAAGAAGRARGFGPSSPRGAPAPESSGLGVIWDG
eukprot:scaffold1605_cov340-Prasinococcus_capsulatus_cf.AAC.12